MKYDIYVDSLHSRMKVFSISTLPKSSESSKWQGEIRKFQKSNAALIGF